MGRRSSQIERDTLARLRAADQRASLCGRFDGIWAVLEMTCDEGGLAGVADAGAA
jgi:hypothetical protein